MRLKLAARGMILAAAVIATAGCERNLPSNAGAPVAGTTATIQFPESEPMVLSDALAERLKPGMPREEAMRILQEAAGGAPSAKSLVDAVAAQSTLNNARYDLTITQGRRSLVLNFRDHKLADVNTEGMKEAGRKE